MVVDYNTDIVWLKPDEIKPNDYNPNFMPQETFKDTIDDIKKNGFFGAIIINKDKIIIDGEHRWRALKVLGAEKIPCIIESKASKNDVLSKTLTIRLNRERGYLVPSETGKLLQSMTEVPIDILSSNTAIPMEELVILIQTQFDPSLKQFSESDQRTQWGDIESYVNKLAIEINKFDGKFITINTISKGGLIPARLLADKLGIDDIVLLSDFYEPITGGLVIDDIYDTGKTYRKYGKKADIYAVLHLRKGEVPPKNLIYAVETISDEYVVYPWDRLEFKRKTDTQKRKV